jgi:hypothetical protein
MRRLELAARSSNSRFRALNAGDVPLPRRACRASGASVRAARTSVSDGESRGGRGRGLRRLL